jgi:hypothetical protein
MAAHYDQCLPHKEYKNTSQGRQQQNGNAAQGNKPAEAQLRGLDFQKYLLRAARCFKQENFHKGKGCRGFEMARI